LGAIETSIDGGLGIVTLCDPAGGNRLNARSLEALAAALEALSADAAVRAILIRSTGPEFCHGMDLAGVAAARDEERRAGVEGAVGAYVRALTAIHEAPKAVIAAVRGSVKAGGVGLASACDVVLVTEDATFELGEAFFGIIPANVLPFLLGVRISLQKARYLILTARTLRGVEAAAAGLADEVYAGVDELERGLRDVLKRVWRTSPEAAAEAKSFTRALLGSDLESSKELARRKLAELLARPDVLAGIGAFVAGDTPAWFGKWRATAPLVPREAGAAAGGEG
jgi:methylglutaconyl-CoA hydratase